MPGENKTNNDIKRVKYTNEELNYRDKLITRLVDIRNDRDKDQHEFDDQNYPLFYDTNRKAANSYIPPKKNKEDSRIVSGITHEKEVSLLSALLNYNLEPNISAYDKNDIEIDELGETMEDMIIKSRKIEQYEDKKALIYKEFLDQGNVFVEDVWAIRFSLKKSLEKGWENLVKSDIKSINWTEKFEKTFEGAEVTLLQGTKVYLGNINEPDIRLQPDLFTVEHIPYEIAKTLYGSWERWENVPRKIERLTDELEERYHDWSLTKIEQDYVEVLKYQAKPGNEHMILLNGVMMLPIYFPLTAISMSGEYTIAKGDLDAIPFFAYSKSIPSKTKVDQAVFDEMIKLIVLKTQQSFKPPMANNSKRILSKRIFYPGNISNDVDAKQIQPLVDARGVTPAEFSAVEFIKGIIDSKSVSPVFQGESPVGDQTATEIIELKKQQMMKLGLTIFGVIMLEKQLSWLRLYNILENWTKPIDTKVDNVKKGIKDVYRTISVKSTLEDGQEGTKIYEFNPELANTVTEEQVRAEEEFLSDGGKPVRKKYLNPEEFRAIKAIFYIDIVPTEKSSSELDRMLFKDNVGDAIALFGYETLNMEHIKQRFAVLNKEDPDKFFIKGQAMPTAPPEERQNPGGAGNNANIPLPRLNEMVQ